MKRIRKLVILGVLFVFSAVISAVYIYSNSNPTVISRNLDKPVLGKTTSDELLKGEKIKGEFRSTQNYLGQVSVRFYNFERINSDSVIFRFKEKGSAKWYYENVYKTDQFQPNQLFPFGLPIISDSKDKNYVFEVESVAGKPEDAIALSPNEPTVSLSYQYPKRLILKDPSVLSEFSTNKLSGIKLNLDFAVSLITYLVTVSLFTLLLYMLLDVGLKVNYKSLYKINSSRVILLGITFLVFSFPLLYLKKPALSETVSIASYFLLAIGTLCAFIEAKIAKKQDL